MGIHKTINLLKTDMSTIEQVKSVEYGDVRLVTDKADIEYPFVNFDIVSSNVTGNAGKTYTIRLYCLDRNEPYIAFNKTELIVNTFMDYHQLQNYSLNYFTLDYKDQVNGVFVDIQVDTNTSLQCLTYDGKGYITLENGDLIAKYLLNEIGGKLPLEN